MKIVFSYNQVCQLQIATIRRAEIYNLSRSYLGYSVGDEFTDVDLLDFLLGDDPKRYLKDSQLHIYLRGQEFNLSDCLHAVQTIMAVKDIQVNLNALAENRISLSIVAKTVKKAKMMIEAVEW